MEKPSKKICFCQFTTDETIPSSTQQELLTIEYSLSSFSRILIHETVNIRAENFIRIKDSRNI